MTDIDLDLGEKKLVHDNYETILELPAPPQTFYYSDLTSEEARRLHKKLASTELLEKVDFIQRRGTKIYEWKLQPKAIEAANKFAKDDGLLPCGHSGFVNEGGVLRCKRCDEPHAKEAVQS